jgi:hypothetical protein
MNSPSNPYQSQESFEDEPETDVLLDSLLSEWLGGETPRDQPHEFEAISVAAQNQRFGKPLFSDDELLAAANKAWEETQFDATLLEAQYMPYSARAADTVAVRRAHLPDRSKHQPQYVKWAGLAIAASVVGVMAAYPVFRWSDSTQMAGSPKPMEFPKLGSGPDDLFPSPNPSAVANTGGDNSGGINTGVADPSSVAANQAKPSDAGSTIGSTAENPSPATDALASNATSPSSTSPQNPVSELGGKPNAQRQLGSPVDRETVEVVDVQLKHLWDRLKIAPGKGVDLTTLENRLSQVLIGRLPTTAEQEWARKAAGNSNPIDAAHALALRWIDSDEFELHWARALSEYYLDSSMSMEENESFQRFVGWLQQEIGSSAPLATIENRLITTDSKGESPESHWLKRWIAIGKTAPSHLLSSTAQKLVGHESEQVAALETVALQGIRLSGQSIATCSQCHRQMDSQTIPYPGMEIAGVQQESLFGTASALISLLHADSTVAAKSEVYASDAEGKVSLIVPTLPNGKPIPTGLSPRQSIGQWYEENPQARQPLVDFVWTRMLGQPLVPKIGLTDSEGLDERRDLLEFLANQVQKERAGLKQLVYWVAMSVPMSLEASSMEPKDFLTLNASNIDSFQLQRRSFARYTGSSRPAQTAAGHLSSLSQWLTPNPSTNASPGLLAQPNSSPSAVKSPAPQGTTDAKPILQWTKEQLEFQLADAHPYSRIQDLAAALADTPMEWNAVVDHSFLVCLTRYPTIEERQKANELLKWSGGNRKQASARLLNSLLGQL